MHAIFICFSCIVSFLSCQFSEGESSKDECRIIGFKADQVFKGKRLMNHVINSVDIMDKEFCGALCFMEPNCFSYNLMTKSKTGKHKCELNNATHEGHEKDLENNSSYIYRGAKNFCSKNRCKNNATCQTGFTDRGYRCLCDKGFKGENCEHDIDECVSGTHSCDVNAECFNTKGSYNCTCKSGYYGDGRDCIKASTCKEIYDKNLYKENRSYLLSIGSEIIPVYCHMDSGGLGENEECEGGRWTLVMKIDGSKATFHYDFDFWSNNETFDVSEGGTGFDTQETKLPTYWNTPFSKICLGMKMGQHINFVVINKHANSLFSLIADGQYRATSLGRDAWKTLLGSQASLQKKCNKEGFNAVCDVYRFSRARIGILGNDGNDCSTCDSIIGFGTGGDFDNTNTCGNEARWADNGDKHIKVMGYILIQ